MKSTRAFALLSLCAVAGVAMAGCEPALTPPEAPDIEPQLEAALDGHRVSRDVRRQLRALRRYSRPFKNMDRAADAGFDTRITECREKDGYGGMGYHYANLSRIDGAQPEVLEPEIVLYAPNRKGKLRLVAIEYIVPMALWPDDEPPRLFDMDFIANNNDGVWQLHVWLWKHNPAGLFDDWNPRVSCNGHTLD